MRELSVRSLLHRAALGDVSSAQAANLLLHEIDAPPLSDLVTAALTCQKTGLAEPRLAGHA
jgi:hypothetical protein